MLFGVNPDLTMDHKEANLKQLPEKVIPYKRTPEFNENSIPAGLLHEHTTKENVWGKIVVLEGRLQYTIKSSEPEVVVLDEHMYGVVEPAIRHEVRPLGKVRFYVEFYKTESIASKNPLTSVKTLI